MLLHEDLGLVLGTQGATFEDYWKNPSGVIIRLRG